MDLSGKIISFLGDSITEGHGLTDIENERFDHRIAKAVGTRTTHNYGVGGTRIAHQRMPSEKARHDLCFCGRAYDIAPDSDVIVVFGGTNDYGHGDAPFGTIQDSTPATFCGGVDYLLRLLRELYPAAQLVLLTPMRRQGDLQPSDHPSKLPDAKPLLEYCRILEKKAAQYGVPVLKLYEQLAIDPNCESDRLAYVPDGLHPNGSGHALLAECILSFLKQI